MHRRIESRTLAAACTVSWLLCLPISCLQCASECDLIGASQSVKGAEEVFMKNFQKSTFWMFPIEESNIYQILLVPWKILFLAELITTWRQGHNLVAVFSCKSCGPATAQNTKSFGKVAVIFAKVAVKLRCLETRVETVGEGADCFETKRSIVPKL